MKRWHRGFEIILWILLLVRPSLDWFTDAAFGGAAIHFNPAACTSLLLLLCGFAWILSADRHTQHDLLRQPILQALLLWSGFLFLWAIVPILLHGSSRLSGLREWIRLFSYVPLFGMVVLSAQRSPGRCVHMILYSMILPAVVGFYQLLFHAGMLIKNVQRVSGTFVHPNPFSFYLVLIIALAYARLRGTWSHRLAMAMILLAFPLLVTTYSFTGAAMFGVASFTIACLEHPRLRLAAFVAALVFVCAFLLSPTGGQRLKDEAKVENLDMIERTGKHTTSLTWRLVNWRFLYREWKKSPWVGHGLASTPRVNPMLNPQKVGSDAHNDYMRFLVETGLVGLLAFLLFLGVIGRTLWRNLRAHAPPEALHLQRAAFALYAAWLVGSLNDNLITATAYQYALWAVFAIACASTMRANPAAPDEYHEPLDHRASL